MLTEINFKFYKGLKGIEIVLVPCNVIILDRLNKTVKIDIFIDVISRYIHTITIVISFFIQQVGIQLQLLVCNVQVRAGILLGKDALVS